MFPIKTTASITHQETFGKVGFHSSLRILGNETLVCAPDYKLFIQPATLRRMSPVLRMAVTAARRCQNDVAIPFDAISVGTALGCLTDTERFLITVNTVTGDVLSPTAFIQSTHNTIGGQISLDLQNFGYNMTHTQNHVSFETALLDAMLCCSEGCKNVLVGAADEAIPFLEKMPVNVINRQVPLSSGSTFFVLGSESESDGKTCFEKCEIAETTAPVDAVMNFLETSELSMDQISMTMVSDEKLANKLPRTFCYLPYSGLYYTASAFASHIAADFLEDKKVGRVLVVNSICPGKVGIVLLNRNVAPN